MKAYGYIRVSTAEQAGSGHSIDDQRRRIAGYCQANGLELAHIYVDAAISAVRSLEKREGGQYLAPDSEHYALTKGDVVVATKLDRLFRNALDCLSTVEAWRKQGVSMHVMDLNIDTSKPVGNLLLQIMAAVAEMERAQVSERTKAISDHLKASGRVYSQAPYGYTAVDGRLVPEPTEQKVISRMKKMRAKGLAYGVIARKLSEEEVATKNGGTWAAFTVQKVLRQGV